MNGLNPDLLEHFSWWQFGLLAGIYTFIVFTSSGYRSKAMVFSRRNAVPASTVWAVHLQFVLALLALMWTVTALYPHFPGWMTDTWIPGRSRRFSVLDLAFFLAMGGLCRSEHRRVYAEVETEGEHPQ